ncbi:MAG: OsmC family protein, partial [Pseudomonadota bacterium]
GHFATALPEIMNTGEADVMLGQRPFRIQKQFVDDLKRHDIIESASNLNRALLILHAPRDETVGIDNASTLFLAAKHPKSYVSLDTANHLVEKREDAAYAAQVIAAWAERYLDLTPTADPDAQEEETVVVTETAQGKYQSMVKTGAHYLIADEPASVGGLGSGPSPYDLLSASLGACTVMTLRMYADRKNIPLDRAICEVQHEKTHVGAMQEGEAEGAKPDLFTRTITLEGNIDTATRNRMFEIADKCPVHRTLHRGARVVTEGNKTS